MGLIEPYRQLLPRMDGNSGAPLPGPQLPVRPELAFNLRPAAKLLDFRLVLGSKNIRIRKIDVVAVVPHVADAALPEPGLDGSIDPLQDPGAVGNGSFTALQRSLQAAKPYLPRPACGIRHFV